METWRGGGGGAGGGGGSRRGWFERGARAESSSLPCESLAATQTTPRLSVKKGGGDASSGRLTETGRFRSGSDEEMSGALPVLLLLLLVRPLAALSPTTSPWAAVIGSAVDLLAARQTARRGKNMKPVESEEEEKKRNKEQRCFSKQNRKKVKQGAHLAWELSRELSSIDSHRLVLENFHRVSISAGLRRPAPIRALWGK